MASVIYTDDTVSGQYIQMLLYPAGGTNGAVVSGLQQFKATGNDPFDIRTDTARKLRYVDSGPFTVDWSFQRWEIRKQDITALLGLQAGFDDYGNYDWKRTYFDMGVNFLELASTGITAGSGGWMIHVARMSTWEITLDSPTTLVMENLTGKALALTQKAWG